MLRTATKYAMERHQFGRSLASFGLIQQKLGEMAARIFAVESATYRTAANIDAVMATGEMMDLTEPAFPRGMEELAVECSIIKITCSEVLYFVTDEALQIHGGYGFTEEFTPARASRDARINRIFEGTNEINRLFITSTLLRRVQRGRFALPTAAPEKFVPAASDAEPLAKVESLLKGAKQLSLLLAGIAAKKFAEKLAEQQEIVAAISDMISEIYLIESALLRTKKSIQKGLPASAMTDLTLTLMNESVGRLEQRTAVVLAACTNGDELQGSLKMAHRLLAWTPLNLIDVRRRIATRLCDVGSYPALVAQ